LRDVPVTFQIAPSVLRDVVTSGPARIQSRGTFRIVDASSVHLEGFSETSLPRSEIAESGVIISAEQLHFESAANDLVFDTLRVELPDGLPSPNLEMRQARIGATGLSGEIRAKWALSFDTDSGQLRGEAVGNLFGTDGIQVGLDEVSITFAETRLTQFRLR